MRKNGKEKQANGDTPSHGSQQQSAKFSGNYQFVTAYLNDNDREWLDANSDQSEELVFNFVFGIPEHFKFSLSFDAKTERYLATLARNDVGHNDSGKILTGRGATPLAASFVLVYLHTRKFAAGWGEAANAKPSLWG